MIKKEEKERKGKGCHSLTFNFRFIKVICREGGMVLKNETCVFALATLKFKLITLQFAHR